MSMIRNYLKFYSYASQSDRLLLAFSCLCAAIGGPLQLWFVLEFLKSTDALKEGGEEVIEDLLDRLPIFFFTTISGWLACIFWHYGFSLVGEKITNHIRGVYLLAMAEHNIEWFDLNKPAELTTEMSQTMTKIRDGTSEKLGQLIYTIFFVFATLGTALYAFPSLTLIICSISPAQILLIRLVGGKYMTANREVQRSNRIFGGLLEEILGSIKTITGLNAQESQLARLEQQSKQGEPFAKRAFIFYSSGPGIVLGSVWLIYGIGFYYSGLVLQDGRKNWWGQEVKISSVLVVLFRVPIAIRKTAQLIPATRQIAACVEKLPEMLSLVDSYQARQQKEVEKYTINSSEEERVTTFTSFEFRSVSFAYSSRPDLRILDNFNLKILPNQSTAFVGHTGCGKSTVMKLIECFYTPDCGEILLNGINLKEINPRVIREQIAMVSQEPVLFNVSIAENIRYGRLDATRGEIEQAARQANASPFIAVLPDHFDTPVGATGGFLSGGQRQRIAIARALIRNPKILLLDEATAALDNRSEREIQETLNMISKTLTTITIAHRLRTIQNSDRIVVMEHGRVLEQGNHEELLKLGGEYASLVGLQQISNSGSEDELSTLSSPDFEDSEIVQIDWGSDSEREGSHSKLPSDGHIDSDHLNTVGTQAYTEAPFETEQESFLDAISAPSPSSFEKGGTDLGGQNKEAMKSRKMHRGSKPGKEQQSVSRFVFNSWTSKERFLFLVGLFLCLCSASLLVIQAFLIGAWIHEALEPEDGNFERLSELYALINIGLGVLLTVTIFSNSLAFIQVSHRLTMRLRDICIKKLLSMDMTYFDKNPSGAVGSDLISSSAKFEFALGPVMANATSSIMSSMMATVLALLVSWRMGLLAMSFSPILLGCSNLGMRRASHLEAVEQEKTRRTGALFSEYMTNMKTVHSFNLQATIANNYAAVNEGNLDVVRKFGIRQGLLFGLESGGRNFFNLLVRFGGAYMMMEGLVTTAEVLICTAVVSSTSESLAEFLSVSKDLEAGVIAGRHIQRKTQLPSKAHRDVPETKTREVFGRISLHDVKFRYPTRPDFILKGVTLDIEAKTKFAIVGGSGSGKSTIIQLLLRFYDPISGSILIDGRDLTTINPQTIRDLIGIVSQEPVLFDMSIEENIRCGKPGATFEEVYHAAEIANALEFIHGMTTDGSHEDGGDTKTDGFSRTVGLKGEKLSGGQKQRIAIARAILKEPKILLLDEATSALDSISEKVVQAALDQVMEGKTTIIVAHRLSTIKDADRICVMQDGIVQEVDDHDGLLSRKGSYYQLVHSEK